MKAKHWYDSLWVYAIIYFALGFFNILFALQPPLRTGTTVQQAGN